MIRTLLRSVRAAVVFLVLCGLAYPLVEVAIAQTVFPHQAQGSLTPDGSTLVGQSWRGPRWFHGRPDGNDPMATGGTNLGPRSAALVSSTRRLVAYWRAEGVVPTEELVTTSGSGVDPQISVASALAQVPMVHRATGVPVGELRQLVVMTATGPEFGFLGERVVDVLALNMALARLERRAAISR